MAEVSELDRFTLYTAFGDSDIVLMMGDVTKLNSEQKFDVMLTPVYVSEDGRRKSDVFCKALKENLNLDMDELAETMELDLRDTLSCWATSYLEESLPFCRIVCFEMHKNLGTLSKHLSMMFQALVSICNNRETTVIVPVCSAENQDESMKSWLSALINTGCEWILSGLPVRHLSLVVSSGDMECLQLFAQLKNRRQEKESEVDSALKASYKVCISFSECDKHLAEQINKSLSKQGSHITVHSTGFVFSQNMVWRDHVFQVMKQSKRILVVLTPAYIADKDCIEQFNMALCCKRLHSSQTITVFYLETVKIIPSFMNCVRLFDCRINNKEGDRVKLLDSACAEAVKDLFLNDEDAENGNDSHAMSKDITNCDIFVSYSHQHQEHPRKFASILRTKHPDITVNFDMSGLASDNDDLVALMSANKSTEFKKDEHLKQQALYDALDKAQCVVVFLSPGYIKTPVCNEEFSIALARDLAEDSILLIPLLLDALESVPRRFNTIPCVDLGNNEGSLELLAESLVETIRLNKATTYNPDVKVLKQMLQEKRAAEFKERFCLDGGHVVRTDTTNINYNCDGVVALFFAEDCRTLAAIMSVITKQHAPRLVCQFQASAPEQRKVQVASADMVVIFVSDLFVSSQPMLELLHILLCRQRAEPSRRLAYLIQSSHETKSPFYPHTLPFSVSLDDNIWRRLERASSNKNPRYSLDLEDVGDMHGVYRCTVAQNLGLTAAVHDVIHLISQKTPGSSMPYNIINVAQFQNDLKHVSDNLVSVHEHIITLASLNHLLTSTDVRKAFWKHSPKTPSASGRERKAKSVNPTPDLEIVPGQAQCEMFNNETSDVTETASSLKHRHCSITRQAKVVENECNMNDIDNGIQHDLRTHDGSGEQGQKRFSKMCGIL